ncbi:helix-turn-helix transcriptional regulator [Demequina silvatica]|uniref:helix-turn-helix transcriptional regulator n=1 Tax=Demequina silvatica TaxID=1638988 RepID=UPI0007865AE3|nr:YafY family protein [Demequina silvatica]
MASTERTLALLDLLQRHRHWTGAELAERLGTTQRTVRRDVERLRDMGYRIDSAPGARGGYRLEAGTSLPPLLLSADEAVAMAVGLRIAAAERLVDGAESALAALGKLDQLLPADLRRRVAAIAEALHPVTAAPVAPVDSDLLGTLALACRDRERVRFTYTASDGAETRRRVEPHALAPSHRRWYLVCWDLEREAWRTFRVDRIADLRLTRARFTPRALTPERIEEMVAVATSWTPQPVEVAAVVAMPLDTFAAAMGDWGQGATDAGDGRTRWPFGGREARDLLYAMSWLPGADPYALETDDSTRAELRAMLARMLASLDAR